LAVALALGPTALLALRGGAIALGGPPAAPTAGRLLAGRAAI